MTFDPQKMASKMTSDYLTAFFMFHGQFVTRNCRINEGSMNLMFTLGCLLRVLLPSEGRRSWSVGVAGMTVSLNR